MKNQSKIYLFLGLLIIGFLILVGRLFELQVIFGSQNRSLAEGNRIKREILPAPRGMIYDRNGRELVRNVPIYRKIVQSAKCKPSSRAQVEGVQSEECFEATSREEALKLEAKGEIDNLRMDIGREYLYGQALAHVLGYLGEVNQDEVRNGKFKAGDFIGRMGVEEQYDTLLRGQDGGEVFEVDATGNKIRDIGKIEPIPGHNLYLSIDAELSKLAFEALETKSGAVVATKPESGQILILVSSPSFDPQNIAPMLENPEKPFFNRAISGVYPPGSTFKIIVSMAGLGEKKINVQTTWNDTGEIRVGDYTYRNWYFTQYGKTEGEVNVVKALKRSTDTFFYKVGEWVGPTKLAEWAKVFGLGKKTKIDLPGEVTGLVPSPDWKENLGGHWFLGDTYHFAIGQGDVLMTPLQVNMMTSIIANGGKLCQPKVKKMADEKDIICQDLKLEPNDLQLVQEGMKEVCSTGGTAFPFFDFSPQVACKTGTAEFGDPTGKTHAWLTAFAPFDPPAGGPQIVVTALVEGGGEGSAVAAPVVRKVMEAWFNGSR